MRELRDQAAMVHLSRGLGLRRVKPAGLGSWGRTLTHELKLRFLRNRIHAIEHQIQPTHGLLIAHAGEQLHSLPFITARVHRNEHDAPFLSLQLFVDTSSECLVSC